MENPSLATSFPLPPKGFGRLYLPVKVPGKRRISTVSALARIGASCLAMFLLTRNWSRRFGSFVEVEGPVGGLADHRPGQVPEHWVVGVADSLALASAESVGDQ